RDRFDPDARADQFTERERGGRGRAVRNRSAKAASTKRVARSGGRRLNLEIEDPAAAFASDNRIALADVVEDLRTDRHSTGEAFPVARLGQREAAAHP